MKPAKCVYRQLSLPVPMFDHLKSFQRSLEAERGVTLSNSQALAVLMEEHQKFYAARGAK